MDDATVPLLDSLHADLGDALRFVARYTGEDDFDVRYIRSDVADRRPQTIIETLYQEMLYANVERDYLEGKLDSGRLESVVFSFEDVIICNFFDDDLRGFVVSFDPGTDVSLGSFLDCYEQWGYPA